MPTRRDHLLAYRFQNRRARSALLTGRPNVLEPPLRGLTTATLSSITMAFLLAAGVAAFGLVRPPADDGWRAANVVIVENETAAVYVRIDGVLHPVVNFASAVLAVTGSRPATVVHVDRSVLDGRQRGPMIGIAQLPTALPAADQLVSTPFAVCSRTSSGDANTRRARVTVEIGGSSNATPLPAGDAVVVRSAGDEAMRLIAGGRQFVVGSPRVATALQLDTTGVVTVGSAFLAGVPAGPPLRAPAVADAGAQYPTPIAGRPVAVGRLLHDTDDERYLLVLPDGVAELSDLQARLLETLPLPPAMRVEAPVDVSRSDVLDLPPSTTAWSAVQRQLGELPARVPRTGELPGRRGALCIVYRGSQLTPTLAVPAGAFPSSVAGSAPAATRVTESSLSAEGIADDVTVFDGRAALLRSSSRPATTYLVAEPGRRYAVPSADVLAGFGYAKVRPATVPARLLALIPAGPALDPVAARAPLSA